MATESAVLDAISDANESSLTEIIDACEGTPGEIFLTVRRLYHDGDLERVGPGMYTKTGRTAAESAFEWQTEP